VRRGVARKLGLVRHAQAQVLVLGFGKRQVCCTGFSIVCCMGVHAPKEAPNF
jgi:hypothetical protein